MASMVKWNPIRDMMKLSWDLDQFFGEFMGSPVETAAEGYCPAPPIESYQHDGSLVMKLDLPGVKPEDVHLTAERGILTIEGERKRIEEIPEGTLLREEVCYGPFHRSFSLPEGVKTDQIKARYHDGILEISAPFEEHYLPKKIEVEVQKG